MGKKENIIRGLLAAACMVCLTSVQVRAEELKSEDQIGIVFQESYKSKSRPNGDDEKQKDSNRPDTGLAESIGTSGSADSKTLPQTGEEKNGEQAGYILAGITVGAVIFLKRKWL